MYKEYAQAVNKIFGIIEKLEVYKDSENLNYISNINEFKEEVINYANLVKEYDSKPVENKESQND